MPDIASGAIVAMTASAKHDGQTILLTHHYMFLTTGNVPWDMSVDIGKLNDLHELGGGLHECYANALSVDVTDILWSYQVIKPTRYVKLDFIPIIFNGQVAGDSLPPNVAHAILLRNWSAGKNARGVKHIGGVPATFSAAGKLTLTGQGLLSPLADELKASFDVRGDNTLIADSVIYHRSNYNQSKTVSLASLGETTRVERRRTVGLGI